MRMLTVVFADEIEFVGRSPATPASTLPVLPGTRGSSAKELQELLRGGRRAFSFAEGLTAPLQRQAAQWPKNLSSETRHDKKNFLSQALKVKNQKEFDSLRCSDKSVGN